MDANIRYKWLSQKCGSLSIYCAIAQNSIQYIMDKRFSKTVSGSPFVLLLTVIGTVASVAGVILTIVFRIKDINKDKTKESNRPTKA